MERLNARHAIMSKPTMNTLNFRDYTDTPDHDDACMVCDKIDCICPPDRDCDDRCRFDLDAEIDRQRALGYETFDDYITRTGFPRDEASYAAFIGEGHWMLTSKDQAI